MYKYVIIPLTILTDELLEKSAETSIDTIRKSSNNDVVLKFSAIPEGLEEYEVNDILNELIKPEWQREPV